MRLEGLLAILFPEESRIGEPRTHDALVAGNHLPGVATLDVADRDEKMPERTIVGLDRKIALVPLDRGDHDLARQLEEARVEASRDRHGPFDERRDLVEQRRLDESASPEFGGERRDPGVDRGTPYRDVRDHMGLAQSVRIAIGAGERDRRRRVKAVTARYASCVKPEDFGGNEFLAVQQHDPVHRPHEFCSMCAPAHALRDRQSGDRLHDDAGEHGSRCRARFRAAKCEPLALVGREPRERRDLDAAALGEGACRLRRLAAGVKGVCDGRSAPLDAAIRAALRGLRHQYGEAPRRREHLRRAMRDAGGVETLGEAVGERLRERGESDRRQFLAAEFEQHAACAHGNALRVGGTPNGFCARSSSGKPSASRLSR